MQIFTEWRAEVHCGNAQAVFHRFWEETRHGEGFVFSILLLGKSNQVTSARSHWNENRNDWQCSGVCLNFQCIPCNRGTSVGVNGPTGTNNHRSKWNKCKDGGLQVFRHSGGASPLCVIPNEFVFQFSHFICLFWRNSALSRVTDNSWRLSSLRSFLAYSRQQKFDELCASPQEHSRLISSFVWKIVTVTLINWTQ